MLTCSASCRFCVAVGCEKQTDPCHRFDCYRRRLRRTRLLLVAELLRVPVPWAQLLRRKAWQGPVLKALTSSKPETLSSHNTNLQVCTTPIRQYNSSPLSQVYAQPILFRFRAVQSATSASFAPPSLAPSDQPSHGARASRPPALALQAAHQPHDLDRDREPLFDAARQPR